MPAPVAALRRPILVMALAVALLATGTLSLREASATTIPVDACTIVPDSGGRFDFTTACQQHDICYEVNSPPLPITLVKEQVRAACDATFLNDMLAICNGTPAPAAAPGGQSWASYVGCVTRAYLYFTGVTLFGWATFYQFLPPR